MEIFVIPSVPLLPKIITTNSKSVKNLPLRCLGKTGETNGLSRRPFPRKLEKQEDSEMNQELPQSLNNERKKKDNDIWRLFSEAQQNILYLNKQRVMATEELEKIKTEKNLLLEKMEEMEANNKANVEKLDKITIRSELLLRIDSMVLAGMISTGEATDLRNFAMDVDVSLADDFSDILHKRNVELLAGLRNFSEKRKRKCFHVVHICTEMEPVVSVGSLASYVTGLSRALQRKGNLVEVILPKYASLNINEVQGLREVEVDFYSYFNGQLHGNRIWTGVVHGIGVTFIQPLNHSSFFSHERVYGLPNDLERFTYFSRASLDYIIKSGKRPDVLHIHNWETSIVGPLFWDIYFNQWLDKPDKLALCGLDPSRLHRPDRLQDNINADLVNILKAGVVYSNKVIVMSSMRSKGQILRSLSHGLEPTLAIHKDKILIAPHGFEQSTWNPSVDKFLPQCYSIDDMKGKSVCKVALQQQLGLPDHASAIVVGCLLSDFLDVDLENLKTLVWMALRKGVRFVFVAGEPTIINRALESFQEELKDENVRFLSKYDEASSHLIFAGSDIILCPTFDDPVLQLPLKAMKYGAAPVAVNFEENRFRHVGDHEFEVTKLSQYISSTFANMSLIKAVDEVKNNPSEWNRKIMDAMSMDFSWEGECCDIHLSAYASIKDL